VIWNSGDWNRKRLWSGGLPSGIGVPSTLADVSVTCSIRSAAQARSTGSVSPFPSTWEHSPLMTGNRIALPSGTVQLGLWFPAAPARNQTGPCWWTAQLAVRSVTGFSGVGMAAIHCHQTADHWP
jgi:hypothetical protein